MFDAVLAVSSTFQLRKVELMHVSNFRFGIKLVL